MKKFIKRPEIKAKFPDEVDAEQWNYSLEDLVEEIMGDASSAFQSVSVVSYEAHKHKQTQRCLKCGEMQCIHGWDEQNQVKVCPGDWCLTIKKHFSDDILFNIWLSDAYFKSKYMSAPEGNPMLIDHPIRGSDIRLVSCIYKSWLGLFKVVFDVGDNKYISDKWGACVVGSVINLYYDPAITRENFLECCVRGINKFSLINGALHARVFASFIETALIDFEKYRIVLTLAELPHLNYDGSCDFGYNCRCNVNNR